MLALAQMTRAPRQAVRMILLLALASSFASFALVFNASESQHVVNVAAFQAGADFSGPIRLVNYADPLNKQTNAYRNIAGVLSATLGYSGDAQPESVTYQGPSFSVRAVDATNFAQTGIWSDQDSSQSLSALMNRLNSGRSSAVARQVVPAFADALTWQALNLSEGNTFTLRLDTKDVTFQALDEIKHIPTVNDSLVSGKSSDYSAPGGILVDYQTLVSIYNASSGNFIGANYVWLRTSDTPDLVAKVRDALSTGPLQLTSVVDRRAIIASLEHDPLYINLLTVLRLGAIVTVLLALLGNMIASWLSANRRLVNFGVLRALGCAPRQIASVLIWEQGIVYAAAILLGVLFGALLIATIVPALVFVGAPNNAASISSGEFYVIQHVLPIPIIIPQSVGVVFAGIVVICIAALLMMARTVSKPSIGQTLRLNED
jgi:hypothetical protein